MGRRRLEGCCESLTNCPFSECTDSLFHHILIVPQTLAPSRVFPKDLPARGAGVESGAAGSAVSVVANNPSPVGGDKQKHL